MDQKDERPLHDHRRPPLAARTVRPKAPSRSVDQPPPVLAEFARRQRAMFDAQSSGLDTWKKIRGLI